MQHQTDLIATAITSLHTVKLFYEPGMRIIEPHALGYGSSGQILLRAFQIEGESASGEHVNWKLLRLDRIREIELVGGKFDRPRPEYKRGDKAMKRGIIAEL